MHSGASEPHDHLNIANHARGSLLNESYMYVNGFGEVGVKNVGSVEGSAGGGGGAVRARECGRHLARAV